MSPSGDDVAQKAGSLGDIHDVRNEMLPYVVAAGAQEPYGLGGQAPAVPGRCHAGGNAADLGRPQGEPVVVKLFTEPDEICSFGVEREVDHGALGTQCAKRRCEGARPAAALE